ncbi:response regulator transcription factor [Herpetosiphon llansteffanensis]
MSFFGLLTKREQEVCQLLIRGLSNSAIAKTLCITVNTVEVHLKSVYRKLNVHNRSNAILILLKNTNN